MKSPKKLVKDMISKNYNPYDFDSYCKKCKGIKAHQSLNEGIAKQCKVCGKITEA